MNNLFINAKTIGDLYEVFTSNLDLSFETATDAELERLAIVFESNVQPVDMVDVPLDENGFNYVRDFIISKVETFINEEIQEEEAMNKNTVKSNVDLAVEEMMGKFAQAKENIKVNADETKEEYIEKVDASLNIMKGALATTLNVLDDVLGYSVLKSSIIDIMEAGTDGKSSKKDLFKMARKCRELIDQEIKNLEFWADEESLKKAVQLKSLVEDERGKSVFESFATGCIYIAKKVTRKLRQWFKVDEEKSILGAICRSIAGFANVLRAGVQIIWSAGKFAVSFVVAGVVKFVDWIVSAIKTTVAKIKEWSSKKNETLSENDEEEDIAEEIEIADAELA